MVVAGDQLHTTQPTLLEALQEGAPVDFMLTERHGNAQNFPFAGWIDTHRSQDGQVTDVAIFPDLFIVGI
jgi:hypothetical protein